MTIVRRSRLVLALALVPIFAVPQAELRAQSADGASSSLASRTSEMLRRAGNGHSPTNEEIAAIETIEPAPSATAVSEALPFLMKALEQPDTPVRTFALTALAALEAPSSNGVLPPPVSAVAVKDAAAASTDVAGQPVPPAALMPNVPLAYPANIAKILAPAIPKIASHLTEEGETNRLLAATILGGFSPDPPATLYAPLLAFLKRDDAVGAVGTAVFGDLLQVGPVSPETATALARYLRRSDQTPDARANLTDAIATKPNQSAALNKALLSYLDSDDPPLRARVILSLPQLELSPETFAEMKARVAQLAANDGENLQVVTAAKQVTTCWTATRMLTGCPVY